MRIASRTVLLLYPGPFFHTMTNAELAVRLDHRKWCDVIPPAPDER
jgi:hypothetical protein